MDEISTIAERHGLHVVEDSCHGIQAKYKGQGAGSFGAFGCFSLHPLKNLNVWGDGGLACTNSDELAEKMRLMRNHGLMDRDHCAVFAYNSRLDTIQAVVASHLLKKIDHITESRIANARYFDEQLGDIPEVTVPARDADEVRQVFHIYSLRYERREELCAYLLKHGVDAKVHYPVAMHLQPAAASWGYKKGDFPVAEACCDTTMSLPVHEFVTRAQQDKVVDLIRGFYK